MGTSYSFGAATFEIRITRPGGLDEAEVTEVHIPGGDTNYVDIGGLRPRRVELELFFEDKSAYSSLRALVGTQATLTWTGGTDSDVALVSLRETWWGPGDQVKADAVFIIP